MSCGGASLASFSLALGFFAGRAGMPGCLTGYTLAKPARNALKDVTALVNLSRCTVGGKTPDDVTVCRELGSEFDLEISDLSISIAPKSARES